MNLSLVAASLLAAAPMNTIGASTESTGAKSTPILEHPYDDPLQQSIPFGIRSFYLAPWRAYMDTWPANQFLGCLGINFNVGADDAEATAQVLAAAGFPLAR